MNLMAFFFHLLVDSYNPVAINCLLSIVWRYQILITVKKQNVTVFVRKYNHLLNS